MKKYSFRLESYLKIKTYEEKICWRDVLNQDAKVISIQNRIHSLNEQNSANKQNISELTADTSSFVSEAAWGNESIIATKELIKQLTVDLEKESKTLDKLRLKHLEAKRELKVIEKLKEQSLSQHKEKVSKDDRNKMAEIAQQTFLRGRGQNE